MTVLLTGSTGFLGSYILKSLINEGHSVIALKRSTSDTFRIDDVLDRCSVYNIDKTDLNTIFNSNSIDLVINTVTDYGRKATDTVSIVNTNLIFGLNLLETAVKNNVKAFINTDTLLERNINAYALSKAQLVDWMHFFSNEKIKMVNIKIEHMFGLLDDENKFIYWLINQLKNNVETIDLTSGIQKRDFIYIDDIVSAYIQIISSLEILSDFEEFELGRGESIEVKQFIELIYAQFLESKNIETVLNFGKIPYRENENMNMTADVSKLKRIGWQPKISVETGIKKILNGEGLICKQQ